MDSKDVGAQWHRDKGLTHAGKYVEVVGASQRAPSNITPT